MLDAFDGSPEAGPSSLSRSRLEGDPSDVPQVRLSCSDILPDCSRARRSGAEWSGHPQGVCQTTSFEAQSVLQSVAVQDRLDRQVRCREEVRVVVLNPSTLLTHRYRKPKYQELYKREQRAIKFGHTQ
jgi:hypothetical protein